MTLITFDEFLKKIPTNKPQDYDGAYGGECVDLIKFYLDWCYGYKSKRIGNADELWEDKYGILKHLGFYRIEGTHDMQRGDILFLDTSSPFDHVSLFVKDMGDKVQDFGQIGNGDKVGGEQPPAYRLWSKKMVRGVWRKTDEVTNRVNAFADKLGIKKRGEDEFFNAREILSILSLMNK